MQFIKMGEQLADGFVQKSEKQSSGCSTSHGCVSETVTDMPEQLPDLSSRCSAESAEVVRVFENRSGCFGRSCATGNVIEDKVVESKEEKKTSWVIDVKCEDIEICDGENVCRICHLNAEQPVKLGSSSRAKTDLMKLGCGCKGELSVAHLHCAEAWFKLKGNRNCEICGQTVNNVRGVGKERFMEEWKDGGLDGDEPGLSERNEGQGYWQGQPLCNFIIACLVIAFVIPWFFRINLW